MNIMVLGATGRTGKLVVRQALDQGHVVTVLVRNLSKLGMAHANLKYIEGDVLDSEAVETAMEGNEAVISTLGLPPGQKSDELMTRCMPIIVKAMQLHGVHRLVFTSGIIMKTGQLSFLPRVIMRTIIHFMLSDQVRDKQSSEDFLRTTTVDWTLVYPVTLTDGPATGRYRFGESMKLKGLPRVSRADVADLLLKLASDARSVRCDLLVSS